MSRRRDSTCARRVHEYGGGAAIGARRGECCSPHMADQRLYRHAAGHPPVPLTPEGSGHRYADGIIDRDAAAGSACARATWTARWSNTIVDVDLNAGGAGRVLAGGNDFYAAPRLSPDGGQLGLADVATPQHAVGRDRIVARGHRTRRNACRSQHGGGRAAGIRAPAGMVTGWRAAFHLRSQRLVEPVPAGRWRHRSALSSRGRFRPAAVGVRHVQLRVRRARPHRLHVTGRTGIGRLAHSI